MIPAAIGVALILLLFALNAAAGGEEEDARAAAPDTGRHPLRPRRRELITAGSFLVLLPVSAVVGTGGAILTLGPAWWWLWLAGAVVYGLLALGRMRSG
jgi:hypothetical protein